jgi:hypothetical protein
MCCLYCCVAVLHPACVGLCVSVLLCGCAACDQVQVHVPVLHVCTVPSHVQWACLNIVLHIHCICAVLAVLCHADGPALCRPALRSCASSVAVFCRMRCGSCHSYINTAAMDTALQPLLTRPPGNLRGLTLQGLSLQQSYVSQLATLTGLTSLQLVSASCLLVCDVVL